MVMFKYFKCKCASFIGLNLQKFDIENLLIFEIFIKVQKLQSRVQNHTKNLAKSY